MMHVLVVEPDRELAGIIQRHLKAAGYGVSVCHSAQTAVSAADSQRPDAVVLELAIAEHNGIAFLQEFRSYVDWVHIPVIIYSQIPREDTGLTDLQWGKLHVSAYLYKSTATLAHLSFALAEVEANHETV